MRGVQGFILPHIHDLPKFHYPTRDNNPLIRFWTKSQFDKKTASKSRRLSLEGGIHQVNNSGQDNDDNMPCTKYYFVEWYPRNDLTPRVMTKGMKRKIKESAYNIFNSLYTLYNCAPETFGGISIEGLQYFRYKMYQDFPFMALCEFDWKVDYIGTQEYPQWSRSKTLPSPGLVRIRAANVVDLTADDSDDVPATKRKPRNDDARASKKQKLVQHQKDTQNGPIDSISDPVTLNPVADVGLVPVGVPAGGVVRVEPQVNGRIPAPEDTTTMLTASAAQEIVGRTLPAPVDTSAVGTAHAAAPGGEVVGSVANVEPLSNDAQRPEVGLNNHGLIGPVRSDEHALLIKHPLGSRQEHPHEPALGPVSSTNNAGLTGTGAKTKQKATYFKYAPKSFEEWNLFGKEFASQQGRRLTKDEVLTAYGALTEDMKMRWTEKRIALESSAPPAGKKSTRAKK
ncbi:hypothetical protein CVT24_009429 [Panaeolus cyanescens]|uniref:Uncharacterized protein n=1 Tax=Panaeolus cyanescens TaxID=181874 RepID=A0A409X479_9AGAR|nr:hypothetical protein CVT24_009429 [Panaeolus cyanescens]